MKHIVLGLVLVALVAGSIIVLATNGSLSARSERIQLKLTGSQGVQVECSYTVDGVSHNRIDTLPFEISVEAREFTFLLEKIENSGVLSTEVYVNEKALGSASSGRGMRGSVSGGGILFSTARTSMQTF